MSGAQFTNLIRNRIHECAPDDSIETITVGTLRRAADDMAELYEALDALLAYAAGDDREGLPVFEQADAALAKARGETP